MSIQSLNENIESYRRTAGSAKAALRSTARSHVRSILGPLGYELVETGYNEYLVCRKKDGLVVNHGDGLSTVARRWAYATTLDPSEVLWTPTIPSVPTAEPVPLEVLELLDVLSDIWDVL